MQAVIIGFITWIMNGFQYLFFLGALVGVFLVFVLMMIGIFKYFWSLFRKTLTFLR